MGRNIYVFCVYVTESSALDVSKMVVFFVRNFSCCQMLKFLRIMWQPLSKIIGIR